MPSPPSSDRYRLHQPLGHGGQGRTYRALDRETGETVAVKVIRLSSVTGWKHFDLFERECTVLRALDHPGIPRYLDTYALEERGEYCLVMELVEGTPLQAVLERQEPLATAQLWNVLHQALEILDYLHRRSPPVIHRDVKPDNLIRRIDGTLALVDFGGVRVALRPDGGSTVIGTFGYMAPEQLHGDATAATDIFGLGATIAAMASGRAADKLPRKGLKIDLAAMMSAGPLRELLQRMVEPDPDQRLATVAETRAAAADGARSPPAADDGDDEPHAAASGQRHGTKEGDGDDEPVGPFLLRMLATLGFLGIVVVETVFLPLLFFAVRRLSDPKKRPKLKAREESARRALSRGRKAVRRMIDGRRERPRLPPGRSAPPGPPPAGPPPRGPAGPRRGRRGRRGRRH